MSRQDTYKISGKQLFLLKLKREYYCVGKPFDSVKEQLFIIRNCTQACFDHNCPDSKVQEA
jgi:hypothetical protein